MFDRTRSGTTASTFDPEGDGTLLTMHMTLPDASTREAMLETGMEHGMEASYERLERQLSGA